MSERRDPVPDSAKYYLRNANDETQSMTNRLFSMTCAFQHLENAAWAEAEAVDKAKAAVIFMVNCRIAQLAFFRTRASADAFVADRLTMPDAEPWMYVVTEHVLQD